MIDNTSKQLDNNIENYTNFSEGVKYYLKTKNMTQAELIRESELPRATINRICRNSNDNGRKCPMTIPKFMAISCDSAA